jgi:hypothetical protein
MSRTCGGAVIFDELEKEALVELLHKMSRFCGVEVLTYCVMNNHFHALVRVPERESLLARFQGVEGEKCLLRHLSSFYSRAFMQVLEQQLAEDRRLGDEKAAQARLMVFTQRMGDVSAYLREVKLRFSKWYNRRHQRRGTLWMDRFKSVLVEGRRRLGKTNGEGENSDALRTMSLYIDLNAVRAGLVSDPAEYRWSGYGAAVGGEGIARKGLCEVVSAGRQGWGQCRETYRMWLFDTGREESSAPESCGALAKREANPAAALETSSAGAQKMHGGAEIDTMDAEDETEGSKTVLKLRKRRSGVDVLKRGEVLKSRGRMSLGELVRHRVRYFSDGAVIGSREFVETVFAEEREHFGEKRQTGARRIVESATELFSLRQLRVRAVDYNDLKC